MKTKIAFYLKNKNTIDCSNIIDGNPGLGGSEYLIILIPTLLSQRYNDINITLYTLIPQHFDLTLFISS